MKRQPLKEELRERPLIRSEEVLEILDHEPEISDSWMEPFASSCQTDKDAIYRRYVHACLTLSQVSATGATHGGSEGSLAGTTVGSSNADASEYLEESDPWDDDDLYVVGPQFQNLSVTSSHGDNLREQGSDGIRTSEYNRGCRKKSYRSRELGGIHLVFWRLVKLKMK